MTEIRSIHGIPPGELGQRGFEAIGKAAPYIPYTMLTKGELRLALLAEQAKIYAAAYPEFPDYKTAASMFDNALTAGVSRGVSFVGALYSPLLQQTALEISRATRNQAPASRGMLLGRTIDQGVRIGEIVLNFNHDCTAYATDAANKTLRQNKSHSYYKALTTPEREKNVYKRALSECKTRIEIEAIVNQRMTEASHHVLYFGLDAGYPGIKNSAVVTKHLFHVGGIQGLANATDIDRDLMGTWTETSILKRNTQVEVGAIGSIQTSYYLSPDPDAFIASYAQWKGGGGYVNPKKDKIGNPAAAIITAIGVAIAKSLTAAADFQRSLNEKKAGAMGAAQNYGTAALSAEQADFNPLDPASSTSLSNPLVLAAVATGAYLLLND